MTVMVTMTVRYELKSTNADDGTHRNAVLTQEISDWVQNRRALNNAIADGAEVIFETAEMESRTSHYSKRSLDKHTISSRRDED